MGDTGEYRPCRYAGLCTSRRLFQPERAAALLKIRVSCQKCSALKEWVKFGVGLYRLHIWWLKGRYVGGDGCCEWECAAFNPLPRRQPVTPDAEAFMKLGVP